MAGIRYASVAVGGSFHRKTNSAIDSPDVVVEGRTTGSSSVSMDAIVQGSWRSSERYTAVYYLKVRSLVGYTIVLAEWPSLDAHKYRSASSGSLPRVRRVCSKYLG